MNTILALDFNSKSIKAAIVKAEADSMKFLGAGEATLDPAATKNGIITDLKSVISSAEKAIAAAEKFAKVSTKSVIISLSNELVKGNTTSADYTREKPKTPIKASEIEDVLKTVQKKSYTAAQKLITLETGNKSIELRALSSAIVDIKVDDEIISEPVGLTGSEVSMLVYNSFAPLLQVADLEKLCSELDLELLAIIPSAYAIARTAIEINDKFSGTIINVDFGKTDITLLERGVLCGTRTFPIGIEKLQKSSTTWLNSLEIAFEDFNISSLPHKIYLTANGANLDNLQETLALSDWYQDLPFKTRPIIDSFPKKNPVLLGLLDISRDF